ncbi:2TM domain-containing protein [Arenibacter nanhaiticus]|uniref:2TM domain-containing protein n=1 Tax=Arenibacter nanhaiticus TaxID=558155 RepID=A0A1M6HG09_9FLAO|nr:2TM domain-containing protein [Arenibacter nanhaiticus]SHJ21132.1 2TM domain-containing protein [Arenibacter nanhaiticus]
MFLKNKINSKIAIEQHEQLEYAQARMLQKKRLYNHFVIYLIGSIFLVVINKILKYGIQYDWYIWVVTLWTFIIALHVFNVFVTHKFMDQHWERRQREKLVLKQQERIAAMQKEIETEFPDSMINKKKE